MIKRISKNTIVFSILLCQVLLSCNQTSNKPVDPSTIPVPVSMDTVKSGSGVYFVSYPGTVTALNQTELRSNVNGYITAIYFKEGQVVRSGQKLYEIDQSKYKAAYEQAIASKNIAESNLQKAQQDADRYTNLLKQDAVARQQVDYAMTDLKNAKLQVASAEQAVKSTGTDLRYSTIKAPFDGTIGISQVKLGALVQTGQTLLNTISSSNPIGVDFVIDEKAISQFKSYEKAKFNPLDSLFTLILPDRQIYSGSGKLTILDRAVDPQTGTLTARIVFSNKAQGLRTGMSCTVRVKSGQGQQFLLVPAKSITESMGEFSVFVIKDKKAHQQKIVPGTVIGSSMSIKSGLQQGDVIVTDGTAKLHDGSLVTEGGQNEVTGKSGTANGTGNSK